MRGVDHKKMVLGSWKIECHRRDRPHEYVAAHKRDARKAVVKFEHRDDCHQMLQREYNAYRAVGAIGHSVRGFPTVYGMGQHGRHNALLIEKIRWTLHDVVGMIGLKSVLMVGLQMIQALERLHSKGYIHGNVAPENLMVNRYEVHLGNLEHAKEYRFGRNRKHVKRTNGHRIKGDMRFASINAHRGYSLSRRDDLESLGYSMVYMFNGRLPWGSPRLDEEEVHQLKRKSSAREVFRGMSKYVRQYVETVRDLGFQDKPDYKQLRRLLEKAMREKGMVMDNRFEWTL